LNTLPEGIYHDGECYRVKRLPRAYNRKRVGGRFATVEDAVAAREAAMYTKPVTINADVSQALSGLEYFANALGIERTQGIPGTHKLTSGSSTTSLPTSAFYQPKQNTIKPVTVRFGAIGDTHLCSKYERLDVLQAVYDTFASEGITDVYHTGNYVDGEARFNFSDIHTHGMDDQLHYFVQQYPQHSGITTHFIAGDDHEGWYVQKNRVDIATHTEDIARRVGRTDLRALGYMEADVPLLSGAIKMRVLHAGGGSGAAISHTSQKIVDSYSEDEKPHILLVGHYHKAEYLPNYRNVHIFQTGCTQEQTPFMRKKRLHADLGAWIISVTVQPDGTMRVAGEFIAFHPRKWEYR
jgi:hypothetical protein